MSRGRTLACGICGGIFAAAAILGASPAGAADAGNGDRDAVGEYKAATDTLPEQKLTAGQKELLAEKAADAKGAAARSAGAYGTKAIKSSGAIQQSQINSYYCGPATLVITQSAHDEVGGRSQTAAGNELNTTTAGTAWYGINADVPNPTGYPIPDVLNNRMPGAGYAPRALPYTPTAANKTAFRDAITHNTTGDYAIAGNAWEVVGGPHLVGHPNREIFHWVSIDGHSDDGAKTVQYRDPVGGVPTSVISWAASVPRTATISSDTITTIMGGRGYVW
ncbi:hypothetical protein [Streptomyces coryli]|uniref:hypothetical protein n=1 Tax=Streptomyces coryli TaxID=1128680 RepID=UPI001F0E17E2|nr:hypothetical protein [Streptomyces coryli]